MIETIFIPVNKDGSVEPEQLAYCFEHVRIALSRVNSKSSKRLIDLAARLNSFYWKKSFNMTEFSQAYTDLMEELNAFHAR